MSYTSCTCGRCGKINDTKGNEIFRCTDCGLVVDRDSTGSRNIFIKYEFTLISNLDFSIFKKAERADQRSRKCHMIEYKDQLLPFYLYRHLNSLF
jgi:transposase